MKNLSILTLLAIFLVSCAPALTAAPVMVTDTPLPTATFTLEPTATFTPEPTATPAPVEVSGVLFLDANGSGLRDEASFICPAEVAKPPSLAYFFPEAAECVPGEVVTLIEPGLADMEVSTIVDGEKISAKTDSDGTYRLLIPNGKDGQSVRLGITDPNARDVALAIRYINHWNKAVVIPAYEINGVQVPEQYLNDTTIKTLTGGFTVIANSQNDIGLLQGYLTLPFRSQNIDSLTAINGFDHDSRVGYVLGWNGSTSIWREGKNRSDDVIQDCHLGIDYGLNDKTPLIATYKGTLQLYDPGINANTTLIPLVTQINHEVSLGGAHSLTSVYGHIKSFLETKTGQNVLRGEIIALSGNTGGGYGQWYHLHLDILYGNLNLKRADQCKGIPQGYQKDPYPMDDNQNLWTVYALPFFP